MWFAVGIPVLASVLLLAGPAHGARPTSNEILLKKRLLRGYDTSSRPVQNDSTSINVTIATSLYHILDTNERHQTLSALLSIRLRWVDEYLRWNHTRYGGVKTIWLPAKKIWVPDLVITNYAAEEYLPFMNTNAIIKSNGDVLWMFPMVVKVYCSLDVKYFPFDDQNCKIVFISWTYSGYEVNMIYNPLYENKVYYAPENQQWSVDNITVERHEKYYACCVEPYPDVTFTIHMRRRSLFYVINLICPCLLIYMISFLGFYLPVESGEKVNLEITVLLALVVFLLMVGEIMPPTPDAIPVVGMLVGTTMVMVSMALIMAVIVTNIYFKKDGTQQVPGCLRKVFLRKMPWKKWRQKRNNKRRQLAERAACSGAGSIVMHDGELEFQEMGTTNEGDTFIYHCDSRNGQLSNCTHEAPKRNIQEDWLKVANNMDTCFFWGFLVVSLGTLGFIFFSIEPLMQRGIS